MKKFLGLVFGFIVCFFVCSPALAERFYIENYDVNVNVTEDKTAHVVENIDVFFTEMAHGIFRKIILKNDKISNITVSERHSNSYDIQNKTFTIKIGNPNKYVTGKHRYTITYDFQIFDKENEFYYNIIGTDWDVPINHANFSVTMPKPFAVNSAGISIGEYGAVGFSGIAQMTMTDKTITGYTTEILPPRNGITVRIPVDNNYFKVKNRNFAWDNSMFVIAIIMGICTILSYFIWLLHGKDKEVIPVVNFYPPKGYNSAEIELLYKGAATNKGITSLVIYLANKGYIRITEDDIFGFTMEKIKPYDGNNKFEKAFMDALLSGNKIDTISLSQNPGFAQRCFAILGKMNEASNKIFEPESISWKLALPMLFFVLVNVLSLFYGLFGGNISTIVSMGFVALFPILALIIFVGGMVSAKDGCSRLFITVWAAGFGGIPFFGIMLPNINWAGISLSFISIALFCSIVSIICMVHLPKRTDFGSKMLGEIEGFKQFLEVAEKWRIESLIRENPEYVYDVLPYAYVLDVSDKWIKKLEEFMEFKPRWYNGNHFTINNFNTFSTSMMTSTSVSSSSSHGGGGHSGGGHGGGGGGSW